MTAIDHKDHHGMDPHAHDVDVAAEGSAFAYHTARGDARELTDDERREYAKESEGEEKAKDQEQANEPAEEAYYNGPGY